MVASAPGKTLNFTPNGSNIKLRINGPHMKVFRIAPGAEFHLSQNNQ
jgi:hypothetical protein